MKLVHPLIILRILSTILLIETIAFIPCIAVALHFNERVAPFLLSSLVSGLFCVVSGMAGTRANMKEVSNRDAFLIVTIAWILFSAFGALPYILSKTIPSFINAFFESTSGFTTTGASIFNDVETLPFSILFWRSFTHWIGGLGIIVLVVLILPSLNVTGYHLFSLESSLKEKIHPKLRGVGLRILFIYVTLTLLEVVFLVVGDMNLFESICHSFGTIATGGFSTRNASMMAFSSYSQYIVMIFMFLAGTSQVIYYYIIKLNFRKVKQNEELWFYIIVVLSAGTLASAILFTNTAKPPEEAIREGFFQIVSIVTCTGFASADFIFWPTAGIVLLFMMMFSGGSTGSTSGGIKMARHLIAIKNIKCALVRLIHPRTFTPVRLNGKIIENHTNISIMSFIVLYIFLFLLGTVFLSASGSDPVTSASSVATCMAGIGPGLGSVGPMSNFSALPDLSKIILSLLMIIGRLEIVTVFVLFGKSFWRL